MSRETDIHVDCRKTVCDQGKNAPGVRVQHLAESLKVSNSGADQTPPSFPHIPDPAFLFLPSLPFMPISCLPLSNISYRGLVLCDSHDTSILIVDTYVKIQVSPRSRYTAVYRSSTKYRETAQVSRVSTIPCSSYHSATCTLQACDAERIVKSQKITIITVQQ